MMKVLRRLSDNESGVAMVMLLVFVAMAITLTTAATMAVIANDQASSKYVLGGQALRYAEAGAEEGLMRLIRDPTYAPTAGSPEIVTIDNGTARISVSGSPTRTIVSEGVSGLSRRKVQVTATITNNVLTVNSWSEIP